MVAQVSYDNSSSVVAFDIATQEDVDQALSTSSKGRIVLLSSESITSSSPSPTPSPSSTPTSSSDTQMATSRFNLFAILMSAISGLEALTIADTNHQSQINIAVGQGMEIALQNAYQNLLQQIWNVEHPPSKPIWEIIVEVVCDVVAAVATALTGNPAFLIMAVTMTVLSETGTLSKLTADLSSALEGLGMSKGEADILAAVIVAIAAVVVTLGVGGASGLARGAANVAAKAAAVASEDAGAGAEASATAAASDTTTTATTAGQRFSQGVANAEKLAVMEFFQTIPQTNFAGGIVECVTSDPKKQAELFWVTIIQDVICALGAIAAGVSMGASMAPGSLAQKSTTIMNHFTGILMGLLAFQIGADAGQAYYTGKTGMYLLDKATIDESIGEIEETVTDLKGALATNNQTTKNIQNFYSAEMNDYTQSMNADATAISLNGQIASAILA